MEPISPETVANYQAIILVATYFTILGFVLAACAIITGAFKWHKTSLVFGMLYAYTIYVLPYTATGWIGLLIFLSCLGCLIRSIIDGRKQSKN